MFGECGNCITSLDRRTPRKNGLYNISVHGTPNVQQHWAIDFVCRTQANPGHSCVYLADYLIAGASRRSFPRGPSWNVPGQVTSLDLMQDRKPSSCRRLQPWFVFCWFLPAPCHVAACRPAIRFDLRTSRVRVGVTTPSPWPIYVRLHQSASTGVGALMMS